MLVVTLGGDYLIQRMSHGKIFYMDLLNIQNDSNVYFLD